MSGYRRAGDLLAPNLRNEYERRRMSIGVHGLVIQPDATQAVGGKVEAKHSHMCVLSLLAALGRRLAWKSICVDARLGSSQEQ